MRSSIQKIKPLGLFMIYPLSNSKLWGILSMGKIFWSWSHLNWLRSQWKGVKVFYLRLSKKKDHNLAMAEWLSLLRLLLPIIWKLWPGKEDLMYGFMTGRVKLLWEMWTKPLIKLALIISLKILLQLGKLFKLMLFWKKASTSKIPGCSSHRKMFARITSCWDSCMRMGGSNKQLSTWSK